MNTLFWLTGALFGVMGALFWLLGVLFGVTGALFWLTGALFWLLGALFYLTGALFWLLGALFWLTGVGIFCVADTARSSGGQMRSSGRNPLWSEVTSRKEALARGRTGEKAR